MSVYFYGCITLDGYLADANNNIDWLYEIGSTDDVNYDEFYSQMDVTVMGKRTFDEIAKSDEAHLAYPTTENFVFTHGSISIDNYTAVSGDVIEFVSGLGSDKNIWIVGGNKILAPLLDANMVDVMIIQIAPVLLGDGVKLFTQESQIVDFELEDVKRYGQFAELVYKRR